MGKATQTFADVAGRFARVMGRTTKVNVLFGPYTPMTTKTSILLPQLPAGTMMTPHQTTMFSGYLDHETGHHRYTDIDFFLSPKILQDKAVKMLTNSFEDTRMENAQINRYPGSKRYLDAIAHDVTRKITEDFVKKGGFSKNHILFVLIHRESYLYRGLDLNPLMGLTLRTFDTLAPIADLIEKYMPTLTSTKDAYDLALKVKVYIDDNKEEIKEEMEQKSSDASNGDPNEDGDEEEGDGSGKQKGNGGQQSAPGLPDFLDDEQDAQGGSPGNLTDEEYELLKAMLEKGNQLAELIKEIQAENGITTEDADDANTSYNSYYEQTGSSILPPLSTEQDKIWYRPAPDAARFNESLTRIGQGGAGMQKSLRLFLQSRAKRGFIRGLEHGELDMSDPTKLKLRAKDVYYRKRVSKRINTDLLVLIDLSGSMPWDLAMDSTIGLCEALKSLTETKVAIGGFYTTSRTCTPSIKPTMAHGRENPLMMPLFKGFDEAYHQSKYRLGAIYPNGLTPLGEAYGHGLELLAVRKTPRRILWLITDGMPYFDRGSDEHSDFILMRQVQRTATKLGITTAGLEIGNADFLHRYVQVCARINGIDEMPAAMNVTARAFLGVTK